MFWRVYARCYDLLWDTPRSAMLGRRVADRVPTDMEVWEVGSGTGIITRNLRDSAAGIVQAHEPVAAMSRRCRRRVPEANHTGCSIQDLRPDGKARTVVAVNVLHMLADPLAAAHHLQELAGEGGRVVIVSPGPDTTLVAVARAHRRSWTSPAHGAIWHLRFVLIHCLLAPLTAAAGMELSRARLTDIAGLGPAARLDDLLLIELPGLAGPLCGSGRPNVGSWSG